MTSIETNSVHSHFLSVSIWISFYLNFEKANSLDLSNHIIVLTQKCKTKLQKYCFRKKKTNSFSSKNFRSLRSQSKLPRSCSCSFDHLVKGLKVNRSSLKKLIDSFNKLFPPWKILMLTEKISVGFFNLTENKIS